MIKEGTIQELFRDALNKNAFDIHIEVRPQNSLIRFRDCDKLFIYKNLLPIEGKNLINIIYQTFTENLDKSKITFNKKEQQDGCFDIMLDKERIRSRFTTMPAYPYGLDFVIRLFKNS